MASNVVINSVQYNDVPEVNIPLVGGGTAKFMDTGDATLDSGAKMLSGNTAYANGVKYSGSITTKTSSDLSASGATVTAPAGFYATNASKSVSSGSATTPATTISVIPSISVSSGGLITASASGSQSITPTVTAGYVSAGTASGGGGATIKSTTKTVGSSNVTSLAFSSLSAQPKMFSFALDLGNGTYLTGSSTKYLSSGLCDGDTLYTTCLSKSGSSARETCYDTATWSYSSGTLTITSSTTIGYFASGKTYMLIYAY